MRLSASRTVAAVVLFGALVPAVDAIAVSIRRRFEPTGVSPTLRLLR